MTHEDVRSAAVRRYIEAYREQPETDEDEAKSGGCVSTSDGPSSSSLATKRTASAPWSSFRERHPRIEVEVAVEDRLVDIVAEGYDAGVRLSEAIERDMVQLRLTRAFRFVVVGAPEYLARHGTPQRPEDLLRHECITFRSRTTGALYAWELERGRRTWRAPVRGGVVSDDSRLNASLAERGLGLAYAFEPMVAEPLRTGRLRRVLEAYAATVPGFFLYFPSQARRSAPLRQFIDTAKEVTSRMPMNRGAIPQ